MIIEKEKKERKEVKKTHNTIQHNKDQHIQEYTK